MVKRIGWLFFVICGCVAANAAAQPAQSTLSTQPAQDEGIPVQSELVRSRCGSCHKVDDKMRMTRISYRRASPENWKKTITRMVTLNHVNLDPADARNILKYLADHNGLAPDEVDFYTLGPTSPLSFTMAPGRKVGDGLFSDIGRYEFWKFDLERRKLAGRTEFVGRPRMSLKTSSNGKVLYIYNAGNTIDLWDAESYQYLRTITLDGDMTAELFVFPTPPAPATVPSAGK